MEEKFSAFKNINGVSAVFLASVPQNKSTKGSSRLDALHRYSETIQRNLLRDVPIYLPKGMSVHYDAMQFVLNGGVTFLLPGDDS